MRRWSIRAAPAATRAERSIFPQWWHLWWPARACVWRSTGTGRSARACGSADVLEELGVSIELPAARIAQAIEEIGIGFLFAPAMHAATRHAMCGAATNWRADRFQFAGAADESGEGVGADGRAFTTRNLTELVAGALGELGVKRAIVVHGADGLDEISLSGETFVSELRDGKVRNYTVTPEDFGLRRAPLEAIRGGDAQRKRRDHAQNSGAFAAVPRARSRSGKLCWRMRRRRWWRRGGHGFSGWSEDRGGIDRFGRGARKAGGADRVWLNGRLRDRAKWRNRDRGRFRRSFWKRRSRRSVAGSSCRRRCRSRCNFW